MIVLQFLTILFPYVLCVNTEKRTNVNKRCNHLNPWLLKVLLSILFNKLPEVGLIIAITAALPFPVDRDRLICKVHGRKSGVIILLLLGWGMYVLLGITLWWNIFWSRILIFMYLRFHEILNLIVCCCYCDYSDWLKNS